MKESAGQPSMAGSGIRTTGGLWLESGYQGDKMATWNFGGVVSLRPLRPVLNILRTGGVPQIAAFASGVHSIVAESIPILHKSSHL
jgi:hypothetical protein